jgi:ABC-type sugar transport system permease subunit
MYSFFFIYPAIQAFWVSLHEWNGYSANMVFIGLGNYQELLVDSIFWQSLRLTLIIGIAGGIGIFALAFYFSVILQPSLRGKKFFRALIFFPIIIPGVGLGLIWQFVYNNTWGPLSGLLQATGLSALDQVWMGPDFLVQALTFAIIWSYLGYYLVILMAGIDKIPPTYFEAAVLDGASEWNMFFRITLPMIWDVLVVAVVLWMIGALKIFDLILAIQNLSTAAYTLTMYIWVEAVGIYEPIFRLGYATALGVVLLFLVIAVTALIRFTTHREAIEY